MKFSYAWLQNYFETKLPEPEKLAELFTFRFSEVESVEKVGADTIFDLKILPDRACYALSHRGVAREIFAIVGLPLKEASRKPLDMKKGALQIDVKDTKLCNRYIGALIEGVVVGESPAWLKESLASLGQRSINNIVDIANYLMLDLGQPLHAFDADKVVGTLTVRNAAKGEKMTTLDNKEVAFDGSELLIADDEGPLGIAGIKGGKRAEVGAKTKRVILEAACFDATTLRRTSTKVGIRTDASKRFENRIPFALQEETMERFVSMVIEHSGGTAEPDSVVDIKGEVPDERVLNVSLEFINEVLGSTIASSEAEKIFNALSFEFTKNKDSYELTIPNWRLDLTIPEDIAEEVGRLYGYENIMPALPPKLSALPELLKSLYWQEKVKDFLVAEGFSDVLTYSFRHEGVHEVLKSLASDKNFLREDLTKNIVESLQSNLLNAPLLDLQRVKLFEFGKIYPKSGEKLSLCIGVSQPKGYKGESVNETIRGVRDRLVAFLGKPIVTVCTIDDTGGIILLSNKPIGTINAIDGVMEIDFDALVNVLPEPRAWDIQAVETAKPFERISAFPFIVRDVAVYVGLDDTFTTLQEIINTLQKEGKLPDLSQKPERPFDEFVNQKVGKKSLAFRLIFQSFEKTLTDAEVNAQMEHIYAKLKSHEGWQIR